MTREQAEELYEVHREKSFFSELIGIASTPIVLMVLEKENAVKAWRDLMGATDPAQAAENTLRKLFGANIGANATHGSDSLENAKKEISIFFPQ